MTFQAFSPNTRVTARNRDRTRFTGRGIAGGRAGGASRFILNPGTNREADLVKRFDVFARVDDGDESVGGSRR